MKIRAKVIISLINQGQALLAEGFDPVRDFRFYVPVGGGVEFGETLLAAAKRELSEELGVTGHELEFLNFHESLFEFQGSSKHEIMFHYLCDIDDTVRETLPEAGTESDGEPFQVSWLTRNELEAVRKQLVPPLIFDDLISRLL